jgi:multidrug resistance protein, MATE family
VLAFRRELPHLVAIATPLALAQLASTGMGFVDTVMAGRLGADALAGIALGHVVFHFITLIASALLMSVNPIVAQALGAGRDGAMIAALRHGLLLAFAIAPLAIAAIWWTPPLLLAIGQESAVVALASGYLRAVAWGALPLLLFSAFRAYLEGQGRTRPLMLVAFLGVGANVLANQAFMFGRWGFPALGITGTGVATALVFTLMALAAFGYVAWRDRGRAALHAARFEWSVAREIVALGWPIAVTVGFETGLFALSALLMGRFGAAALGGHQIAIQMASITFMIPLALGVATTARVGRAVGARDVAAARAAAWVGMASAVFVMLLTAALYFFAPHFIVALYLDARDPANAATIAFAVAFLGAAAAFQIFDGLQVAALGALRGLKDTRAPMLITMVAYWVVGLGGGILLAYGAGVGPMGLWWGLVLGLAAAAALLTRRFVVAIRRLAERLARGLPSHP